MKKFFQLKKRIRLSIKLLEYVKFLFSIKKKIGVVFISTPTHGNLGDQAIVLAQYDFFKQNFPQCKIFEFTRWEYEQNQFWLKLLIPSKQIIIIDGGGNIGTLWIEEENKMRDIILRFPNNPIYIFPQTVYFSDDDYGRNELKKTIEIYRHHMKLTIFTRDIESYNILTDNSVSNVVYTPDIVTFINYAETNQKRKDIIMCMREDKEKIVTDLEVEKIEDYLQNNGLNYCFVSTKRKEGVTRNNRRDVLINKWSEFSRAQLVITDRLHGMIFAAITGTPCLALDNVSHKVKNGYQWIEYIDYVYLCNSVDELIQKVKLLYNKKNTHYENTCLQKYYGLMKQEIEKNL